MNYVYQCKDERLLLVSSQPANTALVELSTQAMNGSS